MMDFGEKIVRIFIYISEFISRSFYLSHEDYIFFLNLLQIIFGKALLINTLATVPKLYCYATNLKFRQFFSDPPNILGI